MTTSLLPVVLLLLPVAWSLPDGPPESACTSMHPGTQIGYLGAEGHLSYSQDYYPTRGNTREPPFFIQVHGGHTTYSPDQEFAVSIMANQTRDTGTNRYKGVLMQVRRVYCDSGDIIGVDEHPLGTFTVPINRAETLLKTMDCIGIQRSAVSHRSPQYKINQTVTWKAPPQMMGHIVFKATVVRELLEYWTNLHSIILKDPGEPDLPTCGSTCLLSHPVWTCLFSAFVLMASFST